PRLRGSWNRSSAPTETALPRGVLRECPGELLAIEVGPERVGEVELGIGRLPEQEVRETLLSARANHEIRVVHVGRVEPASELLLPTACVLAGGVEHLGPAAVVERDEHRSRDVVSRQVLRPLDLLAPAAGDLLSTSDETKAHL